MNNVVKAQHHTSVYTTQTLRRNGKLLFSFLLPFQYSLFLALVTGISLFSVLVLSFQCSQCDKNYSCILSLYFPHST